MNCDWFSRLSCTPADDISYMDYDWFSSSSCVPADDISYIDYNWFRRSSYLQLRRAYGCIFIYCYCVRLQLWNYYDILCTSLKYDFNICSFTNISC